MHGRRGVDRLFRPLLGRVGFRVHFLAIGTDETDAGVVLTERTDALILGPVIIPADLADRARRGGPMNAVGAYA